MMRGAGHAGAHLTYGTGRDGALISTGTVNLSGERHYRYVKVASITHDVDVASVPRLRCLSRIHVTGSINLDSRGRPGGAGNGWPNDGGDGSGNGKNGQGTNFGSGGQFTGRGGGGAGHGTAGQTGYGLDMAPNAGGAGGAAVTDGALRLGAGGGEGGAANTLGAVGNSGGDGGRGAGALGVAAPWVDLASFSAKGAGGSNGRNDGVDMTTSGGGGGGAGGCLWGLARRFSVGTVDLSGGPFGEGGRDSENNPHGRGGNGGQGVLAVNAARKTTGALTNVTQIAANEPLRKRLIGCGVGAGRPLYASAHLASLR